MPPTQYNGTDRPRRADISDNTDDGEWTSSDLPGRIHGNRNLMGVGQLDLGLAGLTKRKAPQLARRCSAKCLVRFKARASRGGRGITRSTSDIYHRSRIPADYGRPISTSRLHSHGRRGTGTGRSGIDFVADFRRKLPLHGNVPCVALQHIMQYVAARRLLAGTSADRILADKLCDQLAVWSKRADQPGKV